MKASVAGNAVSVFWSSIDRSVPAFFVGSSVVYSWILPGIRRNCNEKFT